MTMSQHTQTVTAEMIDRLPEPARRYMRWSGVIGKPWIDTVRIRHSGRLRRGIDQPWLPIRATQIYTTRPPAFRWQARLSMWGLPLMSGYDRYAQGRGHMYGKIAGLFTIFDARGDEIDQGTMLRYLNETTWFPIALLGDNIAWQGVDHNSADVTFTDHGKSVTARMIFDAAGRPVNFVTRRYRENKGQYTLDTWETPFTEYGALGGLNLPVRGQAVWKLAGGDLPYADLTLSSVEYNIPIDAI